MTCAPLLKASVIGILLAAGAGKRFGGGKLLQPLMDGVPLGLASLRRLKSVIPHLVAVVRAHDDALHDVLAREATTVVISRDAWKGMGHSLADAIVTTRPELGWIVALGDMPKIQPQTIRQVAEALTVQSKIIVPFYDGRRGHPVAFPANMRDELMKLSGDTGARDIIRANPDRVARLDVPDPGILQDVDTIEDLANIDKSE